MHQGLKLALLGSSLLFTAPAFAQDAPAGGDASGTATVGAGADANAGGATAGAGATVGATADAGAAVTAWSDQNIDNPVTLPKGGLGVFGDFEIFKLNFPSLDPTMPNSSITTEFLALGAGFGVTDKITAGVTYAVDIHDDGGTFPSDGRWKGPLGLYGEFNIMNKDKLSVTAGADFQINLQDTDFGKAINAGLSVKYKVAPKVAVFTGNPLPLGPAGQHLHISLDDMGPVDFRIPVGVALQPTPQIFAFADTELLNIGISNSDTNAIGSDAFGIPLQVGALFRAAKDLDLGLTFQDDLKNAGDTYLIGFNARFYKH
jgi:hypothetical protein